MRTFLRLLLVFVAVAALLTTPAPGAHAAIQDTVEETARRVTTLASIRHRLIDLRIAAERAKLIRELDVLSGLAGSGGSLDLMDRAEAAVASIAVSLGVVADPEPVTDLVRSVAASLEIVDPVAESMAAKVRALDSWIAELSDLIDAEDVALASALSAGTRVGPFPSVVEGLRPAVERAFPLHRVNEALVVIACESGGDPEARNRRSGASGLFQFLPGTWRHVAQQAGLGDASPRQAEASIAAAAWLVSASDAAGIGPWAHWSCRP
jgi:hypothetical protein